MSTSSISQRLMSAWRLLHNKPGGRRLFSFLVGRIVPYSGSIAACVVDLRPGYACLTLKDRRKVRNHLGSVHAIALANLGELTTGLAVVSGIPLHMRSIVRGLDVSYEKKARGLLTSTCTCPIVTPDENTEFSVTAQIRDHAGDMVAVVTALWIIGPEPRSPFTGEHA